MKFYLTDSTNPFFNLAAEEYYFKNSSDDIFMLWQNEPSVIIGKNQNYYSEINPDFVEQNQIHVARRITGGGAVYHDLGNINYTFITSREKADVLDFAYFTKPIVDALMGLKIQATLSGRNDLTVEEKFEDESGKEKVRYLKFSGNAETADEKRILHHGTLLFDSDLTVLGKALKPDEAKLRKKGIQSVSSRVTNLKPLLENKFTTKDFFEYLSSFVEKTFSCERERIDRSAIQNTGLVERNQSFDYNAGRKSAFEFEKKIVFSAGIIVLLWNISNGRISEFSVEGDFFEKQDVKHLSSLLIGVSPEKEEVEKALSCIALGDYIPGLAMEDIWK